MPWPSLPMMGTASIKQALAQACQIRGIPTLIVLDRKTGHFVTDQARNDVLKWKQSGTKETAKALVDQWKAVEAVPLSEAKFGGGATGFSLLSIISTVAKNPAFIFGLIYIFKASSVLRWRSIVAWLRLAVVVPHRVLTVRAFSHISFRHPCVFVVPLSSSEAVSTARRGCHDRRRPRNRSAVGVLASQRTGERL